MRRARYKSTEAAIYHLITRVAGSPHYYPLQRPEASRKLIDLVQFYLQVYGCILVAFKIMGSHYHLIVRMEPFRSLSREELRRRAGLLWGAKAELKTALWSDEAWAGFNRKLFDLSALMQHLNGEYAKWFNRRYGRRGHFCADRFKNPELLGLPALQDCLVYIETNATRARVVQRPEQWAASSAWRRFQGQDQDLMPIQQIFPEATAEEAFQTYRQRLEERRQADAQRDDQEPGEAWLDRRQRFFSDGIVIGSESEVARVLAEFRARGFYKRRRNPVRQLSGRLYTLREQRSHARS